MIAVPIVLVLVVIIVGVVAMKAKSSKTSDADFLDAGTTGAPKVPQVLSRAPMDSRTQTESPWPEPTKSVESESVSALLPDPEIEGRPVETSQPEPQPVAAASPPVEVATPAHDQDPEPDPEPELSPLKSVAKSSPPEPGQTRITASEVGGEEDDAALSRFKAAGKPHLTTTPLIETTSPDVEGSLMAVPEADSDAPIEQPVEPASVLNEIEPPSEPIVEPDVAAVAASEENPEQSQPSEPSLEQGIDLEASEDVPAVAMLQPEPEMDPVDHVLKALIGRAKARQVGIAEVAAELVEQANLEDRDIDEVLADLVDRVDDDDNVVSGDRLQELTLFNDSVPRRPGQLTDFDRLDKIAKKRVIIRVLCLLVAMQEDNRLTPSEPRSEAETRHWPLSRAVWPISPPAKAAAEDDDKKNLPGRRLSRSKP